MKNVQSNYNRRFFQIYLSSARWEFSGNMSLRSLRPLRRDTQTHTHFLLQCSLILRREVPRDGAGE